MAEGLSHMPSGFAIEDGARVAIHPESNGITEGFHRKMKLIQRRAYGFRNFQNYRLRVLLECSLLF